MLWFVGLVWAAAAPLLLVAAIIVLRMVFDRVLPRRDGLTGGLMPLALAVLFVIGPTAAIWLADRAEFRQACDGVGKTVIHRKAVADGILLESGTSNSFGMRYLQDEGFQWMESDDIYNRGGFVRYERAANGTITTTKIDAPTARYVVRETFDQPYPHTSVSITHVVDRTTNEELSRAGSSNFSGGRARWVLGAWGMLSCPSAMRDAAGFNAYYHLAKQTLR